MTFPTPQIGDKFFTTYGAGMSETTGEVTGISRTPFGVQYEVTSADGLLSTITRYVGTAEDIGDDFFAPVSGCGIGSYLIVGKS